MQDNSFKLFCRFKEVNAKLIQKMDSQNFKLLHP